MGIGFQELVIVLVVVLVIFGAGKVPEIMGQIGAGLREAKALRDDAETAVEELDRG